MLQNFKFPENALSKKYEITYTMHWILRFVGCLAIFIRRYWTLPPPLWFTSFSFPLLHYFFLDQFGLHWNKLDQNRIKHESFVAKNPWFNFFLFEAFFSDSWGLSQSHFFFYLFFNHSNFKLWLLKWTSCRSEALGFVWSMQPTRISTRSCYL